MRNPGWKLPIGAEISEGGTRFRVWAPKAETLQLTLLTGRSAGRYPMERDPEGYYSVLVEEAGAGDRYRFRIDDSRELPDPASRFQPEGVHGPSAVVDGSLHDWQDDGWTSIPLEEYVIYEIHIGTFTREGTFDAVIPMLDYLKDLGVTAVEIMPVAQFPGARNWGYDGVYPFAPQNSYGGPEGLRRLVEACHRKGLAVILDVVYNHFGPEGNYLAAYGHYFTDHYRTPWGDAINVDGPYSDHVREFFIGNAIYWLEEFHLDGLRLDAIDKIYDFSSYHFMEHLATEVHRYRRETGRRLYLFAETDLYDSRLIRPRESGGYGLDVQWNDSFHHAFHAMLTGEREGYYVDFGHFETLLKTFSESFAFTGNYSRYRKKRHGSSVRELPCSRFVVFSQNHDQVGNRMKGDRPAQNLSLDKLLLSAALVILSPYIPLLFMGEEMGEKTPFQYFVSFFDPELIAAVRKGRREEFSGWTWGADVPDPEAESTFLASKLDLSLKKEREQALIYRFYKQLLALRKNVPSLRVFDRDSMEVTGYQDEQVIALLRRANRSKSLTLFSISREEQEVSVPFPAGEWEKILDSAAPEWGGSGEPAPRSVTGGSSRQTLPIAPFSALVYHQAGQQ
jgi:maltooligosyltrehalose trehalohydrolase